MTLDAKVAYYREMVRRHGAEHVLRFLLVSLEQVKRELANAARALP